MPFIKEVIKRDVVRIGFLDTPFEEMSPSRDAFGITVTTDPEQFRRAFHSNGPEFRLTCQTAVWVRASEFDRNSMDELERWMKVCGYMASVPTYSVSFFEEDTNEFCDKAFLSLEEAAAKIGRSAEEEIAAQKRGDGAVFEDTGYKLTPRGLRRLGGANLWHDPLDWYNAAVLLYVRYVVILKRPFVVGVWWDDLEAKGSAPYGVLFPERASGFLVEDDEGEVQTFWEAFPNCPGLDFDARDTPETRNAEKVFENLLKSAGVTPPVKSDQ